MSLVKKWLFRFVLLFLFVAALLAASDNSTEVTLTFLDWQTPEWPISWWMLSAFLLGVGFGVLLNAWSNARLRLDARRAARRVEETERELDRNRAAALTTGPEPP